MTRSRVAWGIAGLDIVAALVVGLSDPAEPIGAVILYVIGVGSLAAVGALLWARVPGNPIGALLLAAGTTLVAAAAIGTYANIGLVQLPAWPLSSLAQRVGDSMFIYPFVIALIGVPLVYPDGRLPSPRFRWVVRIAITNMAAWTVLGTLASQEARKSDPVLMAVAPLLATIEAFILVATLVSFGAAVVAVWLRFRRGDPVQRQQIKWLAAVVGLAAIVLPASLVLKYVSPDLANALSIVGILAMFALPIVIAIAILRYRLYEIDRIISRTIGWTVTTGVIVAVFAGIVIGLEGILSKVTNGNTVAVAASTLVAAALFQPLRRRVQGAVDRRFNRARYDAQRTADGFAERLRNEVDLATLRSALVATADDAVRPISSSVWLRVKAEAAAEVWLDVRDTSSQQLV